MKFNNHFHLQGSHAFLSASKPHWVNYDEEKLINTFNKYMAAQIGTELHEFASKAVELGVKLQKTNKTLNMYVNDAIGFKMNTEQTLYYSDNCFGTCDAISFRKNYLRIHDLKTGSSPASIKQLVIYTSIFCLEYNINPSNIEIELRLYQLDDVIIHRPDPEEIINTMDKIVKFDKIVEQIKIGG